MRARWTDPRSANQIDTKKTQMGPKTHNASTQRQGVARALRQHTTAVRSNAPQTEVRGRRDAKHALLLVQGSFMIMHHRGWLADLQGLVKKSARLSCVRTNGTSISNDQPSHG